MSDAGLACTWLVVVRAIMIAASIHARQPRYMVVVGRETRSTLRWRSQCQGFDGVKMKMSLMQRNWNVQHSNADVNGDRD